MPLHPGSPRQAPLLDTRIRIETPEGIDLVLRPAGLIPRATAYAIDLLLRVLLVVGLYQLFSLLGNLGQGLTALSLFIAQWWYAVLFECLNQGRTPGKQWLGLQVVHDDGTPVSWPASLVRNLLRVVDLLPFGYTLGALCCLHHPHFKRLGDQAAGTLVVYRDKPLPRPELPAALPRQATFALSLEEQRAIIGFAERQSQLPPARTRELAVLLAEPLACPPEQAVAQVNGIARGLLGPS